MYATELINYLLVGAGFSCPIIYLYFVNRCVNNDLEYTDQLAEQPGQTHNTAIINIEAPNGHAEHAYDDELLSQFHHEAAVAH